jgi:hypothetical protein
VDHAPGVAPVARLRASVTLFYMSQKTNTFKAAVAFSGVAFVPSFVKTSRLVQ